MGFQCNTTWALTSTHGSDCTPTALPRAELSLLLGVHSMATTFPVHHPPVQGHIWDLYLEIIVLQLNGMDSSLLIGCPHASSHLAFSWKPFGSILVRVQTLCSLGVLISICLLMSLLLSRMLFCCVFFSFFPRMRPTKIIGLFQE